MTFVHDSDYETADQEFTSQFLDVYDFEQSDFDVIECKFEDSCSSEPDVYEVPVQVKESIEDELHYEFDIEEDILGDITSFKISLSNLHAEQSCREDITGDITVEIEDKDGNKHEHVIDPMILSDCSYWGDIREYIPLPLSLYDTGLESLTDPLNIKSINIRFPGCKIIRRMGVDDPDTILDLSIRFRYPTGGSSARRYYYEFSEETKVTDSEIYLRGLNPGETATFNFENLNPDLDYYAYIHPSSFKLPRFFYCDIEGGDECRIYLGSGEYGTMRPEIIDGGVEVEVRANEQLEDFSFSIDAEGIEESLNQGIIPEELKDMFKTKGFPLSEDAIISEEEEGRWEIIDGEEIYIIRKVEVYWLEKGQLRIYTLDEIWPMKSVRLYPQLKKDHYLTIFATPDAIRMRASGSGGVFGEFHLDEYYKTINNKYDQESYCMGNVDYAKLLTGRVFAFTISDLSAYTARGLFFDEMPKDRSASFIFKSYDRGNTVEAIRDGFYKYWNGDENIYKEFLDESPGEILEYIENKDTDFLHQEDFYVCYSYNDEKLGCNTNRYKTKQSYYNSYFTLHFDHGTENWAFVYSSDLRYKFFQPKTNYIYACGTCNYPGPSDKLEELFCMQNIRRGSLAYIGCIWHGCATWSIDTFFMPVLAIKKETVGKAWQTDLNEVYGGWYNGYALIGDPTLRPIYWGEPGEWEV